MNTKRGVGFLSKYKKKCDGSTITLHAMTGQDSNLQSLIVIKRLYRYHVADIIIMTCILEMRARLRHYM